MNSVTDVLLTIAVLGGILVLSALFTSFFTRRMYYTCSECRALNAKRRTHCRSCGTDLPVDPKL
jgi:ribosomal protein L40E